MKISYNWLKTLLDIDLPAEECGRLLTGAGLEVEHIEEKESLPGGLKGLVVGEITHCEKHPDADRLSLTRVNVGNGAEISIVCGAPNVAAGQKVIVATVGSKLYPSRGEAFEIRKSKIRGAASEGMICAEDEIGIGESHDGIIVLPSEIKPGTPASEYYKVENDHIFEIGLTPNRSDASSHFGVARDLAAIINTNENLHLKAKINVSEFPEVNPLHDINVEIADPSGAPRYSGIVISGITVKESPEWLRNRLRSIDVRPINNIVDVTNYVLHETGQPLHAFDLDKVKGNRIIVRKALAGEKFVTLDNVERSLVGSDLVIANAEDVMCLAGVFGGAASGVTESTKAVFIESAYFDPASIRKSSRHHGLKTDASFRFERGTDPEMTVTALQLACRLILETAGGELTMELKDVVYDKPEAHKVAFSYSNCTDLIGKEIDRNIIRNILVNLDIEIESEGSDGLLLKVPRYRSDVTREADVIEEVMRIYGYNNIEPSKHISFSAFHQPEELSSVLAEKFSALLEGAGFREIMSLSLTRESYYHDQDKLVKVLNPLSADLSVLRGEMIYSGLEAISYNINRRNTDLRLFESGKTYVSGKSGYEETAHLCIYCTGRIFPENPFGLNQQTEFSFIKQVVGTLLEKCGVTDYVIKEKMNHNLQYGLAYYSKNELLAEFGEVESSVLKSMDISQPVFYGDIRIQTLTKKAAQRSIRFEEISKFPSVRRDLALLLDRNIQFEKVQDLARRTERKYLKDIQLFDVYEGEKLGNKKSYGVSFTLQNHEATLTDKQIDGVMEKLIRVYRDELGAELR